MHEAVGLQQRDRLLSAAIFLPDRRLGFGTLLSSSIVFVSRSHRKVSCRACHGLSKCTPPNTLFQDCAGGALTSASREIRFQPYPCLTLQSAYSARVPVPRRTASLPPNFLLSVQPPPALPAPPPAAAAAAARSVTRPQRCMGVCQAA